MWSFALQKFQCLCKGHAFIFYKIGDDNSSRLYITVNTLETPAPQCTKTPVLLRSTSPNSYIFRFVYCIHRNIFQCFHFYYLADHSEYARWNGRRLDWILMLLSWLDEISITNSYFVTFEPLDVLRSWDVADIERVLLVGPKDFISMVIKVIQHLLILIIICSYT